MEKLVVQQEQTGAEIQRLVTNYKKQPTAKRDLAFLEDRIKRLDEQWTVFDNTDSSIREQYSDQLSHKYFKDAFYDNIKCIYEAYRQEIVSKINTLEEEAKPSYNAAQTSKNLTDPQQEQPTENTLYLATEAPLQSKIQGSQTLGSSHISEGLINKQKYKMMSLKRVLSSINLEGQSKQYCIVKTNVINDYWTQKKEINELIAEASEDASSHGYSVQEYFDLEDLVQEMSIKLLERSDEFVSQNTNPSNSISTPQMKLFERIRVLPLVLLSDSSATNATVRPYTISQVSPSLAPNKSV